MIFEVFLLRSTGISASEHIFKEQYIFIFKFVYCLLSHIFKVYFMNKKYNDFMMAMINIENLEIYQQQN